MNDPATLNSFLSIARETARKAGELLKEQAHGLRTISFKGQIDLVTEMDRRSERLIVESLLTNFPHHAILAEEGTRIENDSGLLWIIDPLDGTTNYAHGYPNFAVSIGLEHKGSVILGVVYDPNRDEMFSAIRDHGAYLNSRQIVVSKTDLLIQSLLATGFPYDRADSADNNLDHFNTLIMLCQEVRRAGSAALDLCSVAVGRLDGFWELKLKPWDVAAGGLIVREAGGMVTGLAGESFRFDNAAIVASNGLIHRQMLDALARSKDIREE